MEANAIAKVAVPANDVANAGVKKEAVRLERVLLTLVIAAIGGFIGIRLKLPAGALLGAMIMVAIANLGFGYVGKIPDGFRVGAQIVVGGILGLSITRETVASLKTIIVPAGVLVFAMITMSLVAGFILAKTTGLDMATAFFASSPGGMTEMTLTSMSFGADTPKVALLQLMRMLSIVSFMPIVLKLVLRFNK